MVKPHFIENMMTNESRNLISVKTDQLPLHCPLPGMKLWNQHPKVYLPINKFNKVKCPYCGAEYALEK